MDGALNNLNLGFSEQHKSNNRAATMIAYPHDNGGLGLVPNSSPHLQWLVLSAIWARQLAMPLATHLFI